MNILYPHMTLRQYREVGFYVLLGALIAGVYGVLHDQVTYTLSPEYFTRLKFIQYWRLDFGWSPRMFAALVGFLATWWVGLISGWLLARIADPAWSNRETRRRIFACFALILATAMLSGLAGWFLAGMVPHNVVYWRDLRRELGVENLPAFIRVAYIHTGSYIGGTLGVVGSVIWLLRSRRS